MKKMKRLLLVLLCVFGVGTLVACGMKKNDESGSNTHSGNVNTEHSTGVLEEVVTDAATAAKEAVTKGVDAVEDMATKLAE